MGARSLQVQRQGVEVSGHNLANVNNPEYSRQRLTIHTSPTIPSILGPVGTGADAYGIRQLRLAIVDLQVQGENSVQGSLEAQQRALQMVQAILGQAIDRTTTGAEGSAAAQGAGSQSGIGEGLTDLFGAFQSLSTDPTSITERQSVLLRAQNLADQFNQIDARLATLRDSLNDTFKEDISNANELIAVIAHYNQQIVIAENGAPGSANDLRDLRQARIEDLAKLVNLQSQEQSNGAIDIAIAGQSIISGVTVQDTLEAYDAGGGQWLVRTQTGGAALALTGGAIQGTIDARDGALTHLRDQINRLAAELITQVNAIHAGGFSLTGSSGESFFQGTNAADISVNPALLLNPALLQVSAVNGAGGDNQVALALAQLSNQPLGALNGQTLNQQYAHTVAALGQELYSVNSSLTDQNLVSQMLRRQRDSVSGVSLDEEMTDLMKFQKAYEASARLITTVDELLETVVNLKR